MAKAYNNRGLVLAEQQQLSAAIASYDQATSIDPHFCDAYWNKALALLLCGDWVAGWELYDKWGWSGEHKRGNRREYSAPAWYGIESLQNKSIFLYPEQGLGDSIQFCRYVTSLSLMGARVILQAPKPLYSLFRRLVGVTELISANDPVPVSDFQLPLLSLPFAFKTDIESIPFARSYLKADESKVARWSARLGPRTRLRIGVVWSSMSTFKDDAQRSMALALFESALPTSKFDIICLQKEIKDSDKEALAQRVDIRFIGDQLDDFDETAAVIQNLDLVISTCTSVPHLSGAMGVPTWLLLTHTPDWRWLLHRDDSPWYRSVKLYRQGADWDWGPVLKEVRADLLEFQVAPR